MTASTSRSRPLHVVSRCLLISALLTFLGALAGGGYPAARYLLWALTLVLGANAAVLWAVDRSDQPREPASPARDGWA